MCGIMEGLSALSTILGVTKKESTPETQQLSTNVASGTEATDAIEQQRKKAAMAQGYSSTMTTGGGGVTSAATTQKKTLLGS